MSEKTGTVGGAPPTREERLGMIREFQSRALRRPDALSANLGLISGDLMLFALRIREAMEENLSGLPATPEGLRQFERQAETYLKFVRQIDRLAQIERQLARPEAGGEPG